MREIDYADMLEIPVQTMNVTKKKSKKKKETVELKDKVLEAVNERVEGVLMENIIDYSDNSMPQSAVDGDNQNDNATFTPKDSKKENAFKKFLDGKILLAEFIVICALVATIFLTNIFYQKSAINTFFSNMFGVTKTEAVDNRTYDQLLLGSVVNDSNVTCSVADNGVMTFQAKCAVYTPHQGVVEQVALTNDGSYTMKVAHTNKFSTIFSGLTYAYNVVGDTVYATIPIGYTDGSKVIQVTMFDAGNVISAYAVNSNNSIVWKK